MPTDRPDPELFIQYAKQEARIESIRAFARESNRIEGIDDQEADALHSTALRVFLDRDDLKVIDVRDFVATIAPQARLRDRLGLNVAIRAAGKVVYRPPQSGAHITGRLEELLEQVTRAELQPAEAHAAYEALHPFTDGNGRSGRAVWAWHKERIGQEPFSLPFLHRWYYESLDLTRRQAGAPG